MKKKKQLLSLHKRFNEGRYDALTETEIRAMQALNNKAIQLLPEQDRIRMLDLLSEMEDKTHKAIEIETLRSLVNNLDHLDEAVRWTSIVELKELGPQAKEVVEDIIPYLKHDEWRVRYYAADILRAIDIDAKLALPELKDLTKDQNTYVRQMALMAIESIEGKTE